MGTGRVRGVANYAYGRECTRVECVIKTPRAFRVWLGFKRQQEPELNSRFSGPQNHLINNQAERPELRGPGSGSIDMVAIRCKCRAHFKSACHGFHGAALAPLSDHYLNSKKR